MFSNNGLNNLIQPYSYKKDETLTLIAHIAGLAAIKIPHPMLKEEIQEVNAIIGISTYTYSAYQKIITLGSAYSALVSIMLAGMVDGMLEQPPSSTVLAVYPPQKESILKKILERSKLHI